MLDLSLAFFDEGPGLAVCLNDEVVYLSARSAGLFNLDFGVGSDNIKTTNSALLIQALEDQPDMVQSLFDQDKVTRFDSLTKTDRPLQGISQGLDEFISTFLEGNLTSSYKGTYNTHIDSIKSQNKRLDQRIEDLERYLEQREATLSEGFMRMEEMQSKLNTQLQTLQSSFKSK